jgi:hypothetical protein
MRSSKRGANAARRNQRDFGSRGVRTGKRQRDDRSQ